MKYVPVRFFWRVFIKGLAAMIPLGVTIWALIWLTATAEAFLGVPIQAMLGDRYYLRGMGVLAGFVFVFIVGLLLNMVIARMLFIRFEAMLNRLPLVKSLYGSVKDLLGFFMSEEKKGQQVVMVTLWPEQNSFYHGQVMEPKPTAQPLAPEQGSPPAPEPGSPQASEPAAAPVLNPPRVPMRLLGLVTRTDFSDLPAGIGDSESVAVYVPMSYQLGGFTLIVKRWQIEPIAMSTEDALRFCITAGMNNKAPALRTGA